MSIGYTAEETSMRIPGDMFKNSMAKLLARKVITNDEHDAIVWYYRRAQQMRLSLLNVGEELGISSTDAFRLFVGRFEKTSSIVGKIKALHAEDTAISSSSNFVETSTWRTIDQVCRYAAMSRKPAFISGVSQIGKTACLEEFKRRNDNGYTQILTILPKPTFGSITYELAKLYSLPPRGYSAEIKSRIFDAIDSRTLLIVDEIHQAIHGVSSSTTIGIMEFLRFVHDKCKCGMVFSGTELFRTEMYNGPLAPILDQFRRRSIISVSLPEVTPKEDLDDISRSYGLPSHDTDSTASEIVNNLVRSSGIGQFIIYLQSARNLAKTQNKPISWAHFIMAYDLVQSMSKSKSRIK